MTQIDEFFAVTGKLIQIFDREMSSRGFTKTVKYQGPYTINDYKEPVVKIHIINGIGMSVIPYQICAPINVNDGGNWRGKRPVYYNQIKKDEDIVIFAKYLANILLSSPDDKLALKFPKTLYKYFDDRNLESMMISHPEMFSFGKMRANQRKRLLKQIAEHQKFEDDYKKAKEQWISCLRSSCD